MRAAGHPIELDRERGASPAWRTFTITGAFAVRIIGIVAALSIVSPLLATRAPAAQTADTITLTVGDPRVDGRIYKPHVASATSSVTKNGVTLQSLEFTSDLRVEQRDGRTVFRLTSRPVPGGDPEYLADNVMDARTLEMLSVTSRDGTGRQLAVDLHGTRISGTSRASRDAAPQSLDTTLAVRAWPLAFLDAAIGATSLVRLGRTFHMPAYVLAGNAKPRVTWHDYTVVGRDTVEVLGRRAAVWVLTEGPQSAYTKREIWLLDEPPYLPLVRTTYADGRVQTLRSALLRLHE